MRKFAAHYLLTDSGLLLKNGIAVADNNGSVSFIDTKGELEETERMIFHSGMLTGAFEFIRMNDSSFTTTDPEILPGLMLSVLNKDILTLKEVIDGAKQLQGQFPEMKVWEILDKITQDLLGAGFVKKTVPGLYLISGLDMDRLHFTSVTRLKKIL